jgi:hypothetical protein
MTSAGIIVGGEMFVLPDVTVQTWHDHGMQFTTKNSAVARHQPPKWLVYHWTASERTGLDGAKLLFSSMLHRKPPLSVEFFICNDGIVWQFCDPNEVRCRHASRVNDISIGVEVSCVGFNPKRASARPKYRSPPLRGGWRPWLYSYLLQQQVAANALALAITQATGIPRVVLGAPWDRRPEGFFENEPGGICGHIHCAWLGKANPKIDPGPQPLIEIARALADS